MPPASGPISLQSQIFTYWSTAVLALLLISKLNTKGTRKTQLRVSSFARRRYLHRRASLPRVRIIGAQR